MYKIFLLMSNQNQVWHW